MWNMSTWASARSLSTKTVHPALPIVYLSGKNERERLVTEVGREEGAEQERGRGAERGEGERGRAEIHKKTIHRAAK